MSADEVRRQVARLSVSADALAALGAALDARASGRPLDPRIATHVAGVLAALGIQDAVAALSPAEIRTLLSQMRVYALTNAKLFFAASHGPGWNHVEPEILIAAGEASAGFAERLRTGIAPQLEGLEARLAAPDAAFLEIGVGVGALAIEMARSWSTLRVVGIDVLPQAIALARARIAEAGLADRIELREQAGEELDDSAAFDLAWLPSAFVPEAAIPAILDRVRAALRPGGWLLFPIMRGGDDPLTASLVRLRTAMFGGLIAASEDAEALLRRHAFTGVRALPAPATALTGLIVGQRGE